MPGKIISRQDWPPITPSLLGLVLLSCLFTSHSLAATNEPANQAGQSRTKTDLAKTVEPAEKPAYPQTLAGAKQAYQAKNYLAALKILLKLESDYAGKVEYDYLLGRSALETKNFDLATSAFIRVLTVDPDFAAARFELARTYYSKGVAKLARGPFEQARSELNIVLGMNPPAELRQAIAQYQANIDKYLEIRETEYKMFVEMTGGYDSNIGSTSDHYYFSYYDYGIAAQNTYRLEEENREKESGFGQMQAGIGIEWPLFSNNFEVFGNLMLGGKSYSSNHDYDHSWDQVQLGARHYGKSDKKTLRFRFRQTDLVDTDERYHEQNETMLEWAIKGDDSSAFTFWLLGGDSSYHAKGTHVFSVNYNRQGVEATHLAEGKRKTTVQLLFLTGRDDPQECENVGYCPDAYSRDVKGIRMAWGVNIFDQSRLYSSFYLENSNYDREFFYQRRKDRRTEVFLAINTRFGDAWYLRPEIHYINNDSSINLYSHERWVASLTLGWGI